MININKNMIDLRFTSGNSRKNQESCLIAIKTLKDRIDYVIGKYL